MRGLNRFAQIRGRRLALAVLVSALAAFALGARCIENTSVFVDESGYTHIYGEMYNDTTIQGSAILLNGVLLDANGGVIAAKSTAICPPDSQPGKQSVFDIKFDQPNLPPHASYKVSAIGGKALNAPLPDPNVLVLSTDAIQLIGVPEWFPPEFPYENGDVFFRVGLRNRSQTIYTGLQGCAAAYNNAGQVIAVADDEFGYFDADGNFITPADLHFEAREDFGFYMGAVPDNAAYVRGWLWFGNPGDPTSQYQFIMSGPITLQEFRLFSDGQ